MNADTSTRPSAAAIALMEAAEQLIAAKGIDGVSSREVARQAGQKNHSAVNYNFGSFEGLVDALIDYRSTPINRLREQQLAALLAASPEPALADLVGLMVRPMAAQLLAPAGQHQFLNLLSQLLSRDHWREVFMRNRSQADAVNTLGALAEARLGKQLPREVCHERLRLLGSHIVHSVAGWDAQIRSGALPRSADALHWRIEDFITYSVAGLTAPAATTAGSKQ